MQVGYEKIVLIDNYLALKNDKKVVPELLWNSYAIY